MFYEHSLPAFIFSAMLRECARSDERRPFVIGVFDNEYRRNNSTEHSAYPFPLEVFLPIQVGLVQLRYRCVPVCTPYFMHGIHSDDDGVGDTT